MWRLEAVEKLIPGGEYPHEKYANAVGEHFANRYGSIDNLKQAIAKDPAGVLADLSVVLTAGAGLAERVPGVAGDITRAVSTVGRSIDPITAPITAAKGIGSAVAPVLGLTTGVGGEAVKNAFLSGIKGGETGEAFRENLRGYTAPDEVVNDARSALRQMRGERATSYVNEMDHLGKNQTVLNFNDIDKAMDDANRIKTFKGQELAPSTTKVRDAINEVIEHWKNLDPNEYHTPIGIDALKQRIGDIKDSLQYGTPERAVAEKAYSAIRGTITKQAPEYDLIMRGYEQASNDINEISRTLSLNPKATVDTALRKLQSAIRNNVNTNFGKRTELAQTLAEHGAPNLMEKLSGQAMNTWVPRGLAGIASLGEGFAAISGLNPYAAASLLLASPRLVGETVHGTGRVLRNDAGWRC